LASQFGIGQQAVLPRREKKPADPPLQKPSLKPTRRWRRVDSNFWFGDALSHHQQRSPGRAA